MTPMHAAAHSLGAAALPQAMGKKKNKKNKQSLTVEPWVDDAQVEAERAQEQRLEQLSPSGGLEPEPEPEPQPELRHSVAGADGERAAAAPWKEVDAYLEATARGGGKAQQLLVRGAEPAAAEYVHLDARIASARQLTTLEITATRLCTLPAGALGELVELRELRLSNNALLALPAALFSAGAGCPALQVLDVSSNRLRTLPSSLVRLPRLEVLNASANELAELPDLSCLPALKSLNVTRNRLRSLPEPLPSTVSSLLAAANELVQLPPSLGLCAALSELDVSENALTGLPAELADCGKLKALRCAGSRHAWTDRKLGKLLQQDKRGGGGKEPKLKPILNHLRGGSRTAVRREAAAAADAVPPLRLWQATAGGSGESDDSRTAGAELCAAIRCVYKCTGLDLHWAPAARYIVRLASEWLSVGCMCAYCVASRR